MKQDPGNYHHRLALAAAYLDVGRTVEARQQLHPLDPSDPPEALLIWGRLHAAKLELEDAQVYLLSAQAALPDAPEPSIALSQVYYAANRLHLASVLSRENAAKHPEDYESQICAARIAVYCRVFRPDTLEFLKRARQLDPSRPESYALQAYMMTSNPAESRRLAQQALARDPNSVDALYVLGWLAAQKEATPANVAEAESYLLRAAALSPGEKLYCVRLGVLYRRAGRLDEAVRWLKRALELSPREAAAWHALSVVYSDLENWEESEHARGKAEELTDYASQLQVLSLAVADQQADADAWAKLASFFVKYEQYDEAAECATRALAQTPNHPAAAAALRKSMESMQ